jgi:hypothetical protein
VADRTFVIFKIINRVGVHVSPALAAPIFSSARSAMMVQAR